jgi:hypothetical protein
VVRVKGRLSYLSVRGSECALAHVHTRVLALAYSTHAYTNTLSDQPSGSIDPLATVTTKMTPTWLQSVMKDTPGPRSQFASGSSAPPPGIGFGAASRLEEGDRALREISRPAASGLRLRVDNGSRDGAGKMCSSTTHLVSPCHLVKSSCQHVNSIPSSCMLLIPAGFRCPATRARGSTVPAVFRGPSSARRGRARARGGAGV